MMPEATGVAPRSEARRIRRGACGQGNSRRHVSPKTWLIHAETDPSGLAFAVEPPKHRTPQSEAVVFLRTSKTHWTSVKKLPKWQAAPRRKRPLVWPANPGNQKWKLFCTKETVSGRGERLGSFIVTTLEFDRVPKIPSLVIPKLKNYFPTFDPNLTGNIKDPISWLDVVGEEEAKKPYKYDCLYSENEKPVTEIELKRSLVYIYLHRPGVLSSRRKLFLQDVVNSKVQVRAAAGEAIILHYMDDVLVCAPNYDLLTHVLDLTIDSFVAAGFKLQEGKIQRMLPWKYLGLEIDKRTIVPQKLAVKNNIRPLAGVQQLCGSLNWVRPWLGPTAEDLDPLFNLLKGGEELSSPRTLTQEARAALEKVQDCMATRQANRCKSDLPFKFIILGILPHLHRMIFQWERVEKSKKDKDCRDSLLIIKWVFLSHHWSKRMTRPQELVAELIRKARTRIKELAGCDFECIHIPIEVNSGQITKAMLEHLLHENEALQFALDSYTGEKASDAMKHLIQAFSFLGIPKSIKTDNGPTYTSKEFGSFLQQWGVEHKTGIPYSPTDHLRDAMQRHTTLDPESDEGRQQLINLFLGQSTGDIRQKLQKIRGPNSRDLEALVDEAWRV
ncbi:hypothetical protein DUI87_02119 [Hirundo rustica rustica]|uniref:Integrase catalytic domain-containing protein n=1 Tax=Hirundo rustica rustica TaxID=333673 RepID=A0A3M0L7B7_HIRRU|nr:hypothetical protein DUI87_02119 [Hirundo rustica rustica]